MYVNIYSHKGCGLPDAVVINALTTGICVQRIDGMFLDYLQPYHQIINVMHMLLLGKQSPLNRIGIEHRSPEIEGARSLVYYGGARGMYLILLPSGESYISDKPVGRVDTKDKDEEDVGMEESDTGEEVNGDDDDDDEDSVVINQPPQNASVAEAKPIGLAIAGVGGVASSKPIATAVVGPEGLAVARPIATAIAGVQTSGPVLLLPEGKLGTPDKVSGRKPIANFLFRAVAQRIAQRKLIGV